MTVLDYGQYSCGYVLAVGNDDAIKMSIHWTFKMVIRLIIECILLHYTLVFWQPIWCYLNIKHKNFCNNISLKRNGPGFIGLYSSFPLVQHLTGIVYYV